MSARPRCPASSVRRGLWGGYSGWQAGWVAVLGVDGCRARWAGVVLDGGGFRAGGSRWTWPGWWSRRRGWPSLPWSRSTCRSACPTGADALARAAVGPRWQSVFLTPTRAALAEDTYVAATRVNASLDGGGISRQAHALRPRIRELDGYARTCRCRSSRSTRKSPSPRWPTTRCRTPRSAGPGWCCDAAFWPPPGSPWRTTSARLYHADHAASVSLRRSPDHQRLLSDSN